LDQVAAKCKQNAAGLSSSARTAFDTLSHLQRYDTGYREFDSPLMKRIRREAYGEDIGQHSWVRADDLRSDLGRLGISAASRLADLGCGPCGPLTAAAAWIGCAGTGVDVSGAALRSGRARAAALGVAGRLTFVLADLNARLPLRAGGFDAVMSLDVVLHLRDRAGFFAEAARLLRPSGRFLLADAGVATGTVSSEEAQRRGLYGTTFVSPGENEALLQAAGFQLIDAVDRTASVVRNAGGRRAAIGAHRKELEEAWPPGEVEKQLSYLETVVTLSARGALSRRVFVAEVVRRA
jgi:SAM-dependent methyltransferase